MSDITLIQGDAIETMRSLASNSFDVCVTSPPYNIGIKYKDDTGADRKVNYVDWTIEWLTEALRVCKNGVFVNIDTKPSDQTSLYVLLGEIAKRFTIQNSIVWVKSIHANGVTTGHVKPINSDKYLNSAHELILHITKEPVVIDRLAIGVPYADKSNIARFGNTGRLDIKCVGSTWYVPYETRNKKLLHPASFPLDLAKKMIKVSGANNSVLDPFVGSGTTLLAAKELNLSATGIDQSEEYIKMAKERLS